MLYEFQPVEQIARDFQLGVFLWVGLLLFVRVFINFPFSKDLKKLLQQKKPYQPPFTFASAIVLGLLILILVLIITFFSYTSSFGRFSSLHAIPTRGISITYFELYPRKERQEFVPIENIKSIEYGQRGKEHDGASSCFIRIVTMAGPNHRSAYRHLSRSQCHNVQIDVVQTLCQPGTKPFTRAEIKDGDIFSFCRE